MKPHGIAYGKAIIGGEHAVVYNTHGLAVPLLGGPSVKTYIQKANPGDGILIHADNFDLHHRVNDPLGGKDDAHFKIFHPLELTIQNTLKYLKLTPATQNFHLTIKSDLPISAGVGSSAATALAIIRGIAKFAGKRIDNADVSRIAFETEKFHHGTPSGIDNNVGAFKAPISFRKNPDNPGKPFISRLKVKTPFDLVIANTGVEGNTGELVSKVRAKVMSKDAEEKKTAWTKIQGIEKIVKREKEIIESESSDLEELGRLMNDNHSLLRELGVSHPALEHLIDVANEVDGVLGAKLTGAGGGGNMMVLAANPEVARECAKKLKEASGHKTLIAHIS
ncbi:MAG: mevalonate kinase [Candidatus Diapherotrites archaeon]|nr:mevalonate kinase [Candidatus Diapherotrites archaeon]